MQNQNQKLLYCPECGTSTAVHVIDANKKGLFRCLTCYLEFTTEKQAILDMLQPGGCFTQEDFDIALQKRMGKLYEKVNSEIERVKHLEK